MDKSLKEEVKSSIFFFFCCASSLFLNSYKRNSDPGLQDLTKIGFERQAISEVNSFCSLPLGSMVPLRIISGKTVVTRPGEVQE